MCFAFAKMLPYNSYIFVFTQRHPESGLILPDVLVVPLLYMVEEGSSSSFAISVLVLHLLLDHRYVVLRDVAFEVFGELFGGTFQVLLVILKDDGLVVLDQVVSKHVGIHECLPTQTQHIDALLEELHLDPGHVVVLHLFHLRLDQLVQFVLKLEALHVVHVPVAIKQVPLQRRSRLLLSVSGRLCFVLVVSIATVPRRAVWFPWAQADPTKIGSARLVLADHVVAAAVLLNGHLTARTLFGIGRDPVGGFAVVVALLFPFSQQITFDRLVPIFAA